MKAITTLLILLAANISQAQMEISVQEGLSNKTLKELVRVSKEVDLVIIASEHEPEYEDLVLETVLKLNEQNSDFNCKFWEEDSSLKDFMITGVSTSHKVFYDEFYNQIRPLGQRFKDITGRWYVPMQINPVRIQPLNAQKILSIPVDNSFSDVEWITKAHNVTIEALDSATFTRKVNQIFLKERNVPMTNNIDNALKSELCRKGVFSVGSMHVSIETDEVESVVTLMRKKGYSVQVVNLNP